MKRTTAERYIEVIHELQNKEKKAKTGRIAEMMQSEKKEQTPMQLELAKLGKLLGIAVIVVCIIVFLTGLLRGNDVVEMFEAAIALAVAAIPEGLPAVVTITLALGVTKLVKKNALVRSLQLFIYFRQVQVNLTKKVNKSKMKYTTC